MFRVSRTIKVPGHRLQYSSPSRFFHDGSAILKATRRKPTDGIKPLPLKARKTKLELLSAVPLAHELYKLQGHGRHKKPAMPIDKTRMNIISESLCDDVIERLLLSLQKHMNCDIIDVNPGIGLFSSKLHDVLEPRTHILMEPEHLLYSKFLNQYINSDPTYKLVPASGIVWSNLQKLETDGLLPYQTRPPPGDPAWEQPNNTLLFVANVGYYPSKSFHGFPSVTQMVLHQLLSAIRTNSLFQSYGQVRMLVWTHDKEKKQVLPRLAAHRRKSSVEAEFACEYIHEVAGSGQVISDERREIGINRKSAALVNKRMLEMNVRTPPGRASMLLSEVTNMSAEDYIEQPSLTRHNFEDELLDLEARFARGEISQWSGKGSKSLTAKQLTRQPAPEYERLKMLRYRSADAERRACKTDKYLQTYESIMEQFKSVMGKSTPEAAKVLEAATKRFVEWRDSLDLMSFNSRSAVWLRLQDRQLFNQTPPVLFWDRRLAEPLVVSSNEFFPQQEMCLLDFQPKPTWALFRDQRASDYDYFEFLLTGLFVAPTQSIAKGLKSIAPGALEWIEPRCPSFTDVTQGGSLTVNNVTVRTMNQKMFQEMFEAWMSWPFRPTKAEMMSRLGSQGLDEEDLEDHTFDA